MDLLTAVAIRVIRGLGEHQTNNLCTERFPQHPTWRTWLRQTCLEGLRRTVAPGRLTVNPRSTYESAAKGLESLAAIAAGLNETYALLADDASRQVMVEVLAYRVLGHKHIKLPLNTDKYWSELKSIDSTLFSRTSNLRTPAFETPLNLYDLRPIGVPVSLYNLSLGIHTIYMVEQYAYRQGTTRIEVDPGDCVVDGGGCWGETALYFANRVGPGGKVVSLEFEPGNLKIFEENLKLNPTLRDRIAIEQRALWDAPDQTLAIQVNGPGTSVSAGGNQDNGVKTASVDSLVARGELERVNFIKLDIEGAELAALRGAEATLRRFRPKLAVAVYHKLEDFAEIPAYLERLDVGYRFFMSHSTIYGEETVLFAVAP